MTPSEKATAILKKRATCELIEDLVFTNKVDSPNVFTVRGWIMDELEHRNQEAFEAWLDSNGTDSSLHYFFNC